MDSEKISRTAFGKALGLSAGRVTQLIALGLPTCDAGRRIPLDAATTWYKSQVRGSARKRGPKKKVAPIKTKVPDGDAGRPPAAIRLLEAQARKEEQLAELRTLEVSRLKGESIDAFEAACQWGAMIVAARNRALLIPSKLAPKVAVVSDVLECQQIIDREIRSFLTELSEYRT